MILNKYFILPNPNGNSAIWDIVLQTPESVRTNVQGNKMVVKLPVGIDSHPLLNAYPSYTHEEIRIEMAKTEWTNQEL